MTLELRVGAPERLAAFTAHQLASLFPDGPEADDAAALNAIVGGALERMRPILAAVRAFEPERFDHFHSLQYASYLYLLSRAAAQAGDRTLADRLFCLNRALNALDLYHQVELGEVFFLSHGLGSVIGAARFAERLVIFQSVTVGRVGDNRPTLGEGVVLFPGASVTGRSVIGRNCVIGANASVHNLTIEDDMMVAQADGRLVVRPRERDYLDLYFRPARA